MPDETKRILIVEDSPTMCRLYRMVLGDRPGTELLFAGDGMQGLDLVARETHLDLLIVDINMPRMDGLEFLRRARAELGSTTPALVVSTESEESDRAAAREAGASGYLVKPWTPDALLESVEAMLGSRETV